MRRTALLAFVALASAEYVCPERIRKSTPVTTAPATNAPATPVPPPSGGGGSGSSGGSGSGSSGSGSGGSGTGGSSGGGDSSYAPETFSPGTPTPATGPWRPIDLWMLPDGLYFCDDFIDGLKESRWDVKENKTGTFDIFDDGEVTSLRYNSAPYTEAKYGELATLTDTGMELVPGPDYYVEYRIRPRDNGNTAKKHLYSMARYQGFQEYYFAGLNTQPTEDASTVDIGYSVAGADSLTRVEEVDTPISIGSRQDDTGLVSDGNWYIVRQELVGNNISVYFNGEHKATIVDYKYTTMGSVGLYTFNRAFELDFIRIGNPAYRPVRFLVDYDDSTWTTIEGADDTLVVTVTAVQTDGSLDTYTAESTNETVATAAISGSTVTISGHSHGTANITLASGSEQYSKTISVTVYESFYMPTQEYGDISSLVFPALGQTGVCKDLTLRLTFDDVPSISAIGSVYILDSSQTVVDKIQKTAESVSLGSTDRLRNLYVSRIWVSGTTLYVRPHSSLLVAGQQYTVMVGRALVESGATINGIDFTGLGVTSGWTFSVADAAVSAGSKTLTVAWDSTADFCSVQSAFDYIMEQDTALWTVDVAAGSYFEPLYLRYIDGVTLQGAGVDQTFIQFDNSEGVNPGSGGSTDDGSMAGGRSVFLVEGCDDMVIQDITMKNLHMRDDDGLSDQAEVIYYNSDSGKLTAKYARFVSEQDTLQVKGFVWFYQSTIEGNADFIWGNAKAALFEDCDIVTLGDSKSKKNGGYVCQARVEAESDIGFVFLNSRLKHAAGPAGWDVPDESTYLARSSGASNYYDNVAFINCEMGTHIAAEGYPYDIVTSEPPPNPNPATALAGWREYGSMDLSGNALDLSSRSDVGAVLTADGGLTDRNYIFSAASWSPTA